MYRTADKVIDNTRESTIWESNKASKVESEPDPPYVSDIKVKSDGKVIVKVLVFYTDQTFTEYIPSEK